MDLSNIQPIYKRFENELQAEAWLGKLSITGGKTLNIISIYPKGSYIHVWFMYDRNKIGYKSPEQAAVENTVKSSKKVTKKKATKKKASKKRAN